jgi:hypothetical protein
MYLQHVLGCRYKLEKETHMGGKAINPTTGHNIRVPDELWEQFGYATGTLDTNRSKWLVDAIRWCVREPGAKMPKRPPSPVLTAGTMHAGTGADLTQPDPGQ